MIEAMVKSLDISTGALLLSFPRALVFVSTMSVFTWAGINRGVLRFAVAAALALPVAHMLIQTKPFIPDDSTRWAFMLLMVKESLIGLILGWLISVPFWVAGMAGGVMSIIRTETADGTPTLGDTVFTRLMMALMVCAFAYTNGFLLIADLFYETHLIWPVEELLPPGISLNTATLYRMATDMVALMVSIIMPFLVLLTLTELAIAFSTRFTKRLSIASLALDMRAIIILGLLAVSTTVIVERFSEALAKTYPTILQIFVQK